MIKRFTRLALCLLVIITCAPPVFASLLCELYLDKLEDYQFFKDELLACGVPADDFFFNVTVDEQKAWCRQATEADIEKRWDQTGLPLMQCRGRLHNYDFAASNDSVRRNGLISALFEEVIPETVSAGVFAAIQQNPGEYTAKDFEGAIDVNLFDPGNVERSCELSAIQTELDDKPTTRHWLVTTTLACGRSRFAKVNAPFWLVEESDQQFRVLLAYRAFNLSIYNTRHQGYYDLSIDSRSGIGDDNTIRWQYQKDEGGYVYHSSQCLNMHRLDETDPIYFTECAGTRGWR